MSAFHINNLCNNCIPTLSLQKIGHKNSFPGTQYQRSRRWNTDVEDKWNSEHGRSRRRDQTNRSLQESFQVHEK